MPLPRQPFTLQTDTRMPETGLSLTTYMLAFGTVFLGALAQGVAGFGLALIIGPLLVLISPVFLPGPVVLLVAVITSVMAIQGRSNIEPRNVRRTIGGYLAGTVVAAMLLSNLPPRETGLLLGGLILAAVGMSVSGISLPATGRVLFSAGIFGGIMGTVSGVGLPPVALVLQNEPGPRLRGTLACVGFISILMAVVALSLVGRIGQTELLLAAMLAPAVLLGYMASIPVAAYCDAGYTRPAVFLLSAVSAVTLIVRSV